MQKIFKIVLFNIILLFLITFVSDLIIYKKYAADFYKTHPRIYKINKFKYMPYLPDYILNLKDFFNGANNIYAGRVPDGIKYKNKKPIVIFGCSYAFGQHLNQEQIFSAKLSNLLKKPVYNRAMSGGSFQNMYMQTISPIFYEDVPKTDTVIYVMISDHYRRILIRYFDILDIHILPHFSQKNNKLYQYNYKNNLLNFIYSLYTVKYFNHINAEKFINNPKNADKLTDLSVLYFTESKKELEKHWNNKVNFYIILYEDWEIAYKDKLTKKLENEGFTVISTKDLTDEDLRIEKWQFQDNHHPTEAAWNMLTPKIIERLNLK